MKTKDDVIKAVKKILWQIKSIKEDIKALWHWCRCLEERLNKLEKDNEHTR